MHAVQDSPWLQRGLFFLAGVSIASICGLVQFYWMDYVPYLGFIDKSNEFKAVNRLVGWLPWILFIAIFCARITRGPQFRVGSFFLGVITPIAIAISWLVLGPTLEEWSHMRSFDAAAWRAQNAAIDDDLWPPRLCMVDDLIRSEQLLRMTQAEVIELLGPPAAKGFPYGANTADIHYYLGPDRTFFRMDSEWLLLKFGEDGKLSQQWLYRD